MSYIIEQKYRKQVTKAEIVSSTLLTVDQQTNHIREA